MAKNKNIIAGIVLVMLFVPTMVMALPSAGTGLLSSMTDMLSNATITAAGVSHTLGFTQTSGSSADSIEVTVHATTDGPASVADYSLAAATFISTNVWATGTYTLSHPSSNVILITRSEGAATVSNGARSVVIDSMSNPAQAGTYYVSVATKLGASYVDFGTTTFFLAPTLPIQAVVPQSFSVQITDNGAKDNPSDDVLDSSLNLGSIRPTVSSHPTTGGGIDGHRLTVTTNAGNGYTISIADSVNGLKRQGGSAVLGDRSINDRANPINDVIADYDGSATTTDGEEAYYFEVSGSNADAGLTTYNKLTGLAPKQIIDASSPVSNDTHTVLYKAKVNQRTPLGVYEDVVTYTAVPSF